MFWNKKPENRPVEQLAKTIFLTSLISFWFFLALDLLWPGFVSKVFSVHWFLLVAIASGIWWGSMVKNKK